MARLFRYVLIVTGFVLAAAAWAAPLSHNASLLAAILAGLCVGLAFANRTFRPIEVEAPFPTFAAPVAPAADAPIIDAIDDPMLIVEGRHVTHANAAARAVLGMHIVGEDARVALRHPAAADRVMSSTPDERPMELVGVGERDRRWELRVHALGPNTRLVRLADRTGTHAAERMRVDFVANASHELRTPLAAILGLIETVEDANGVEDEPDRARFLKIMLGEARRMQRLINDLLSLSRIEADKYRAPQERVALDKLAAEVADASRAASGKEAPKIVVEAADDLPVALGDRAQLSQVLHNLVGNALKYGKPGGVVRVTIGPAPNGMLSLAVSDSGDGIAAEHLPRLTERFYRVDPGRSRAGGGTGLGLAIVKHIVERHRGRLDIASTPGVGTTVTVILPAAAVLQVNEPVHVT